MLSLGHAGTVRHVNKTLYRNKSRVADTVDQLSRVADHPIFETAFHGLYTDTESGVHIEIQASKALLVIGLETDTEFIKRFPLKNGLETTYNTYKWSTPGEPTLKIVFEPLDSDMLATYDGTPYNLNRNNDAPTIVEVNMAERRKFNF